MQVSLHGSAVDVLTDWQAAVRSGTAVATDGCRVRPGPPNTSARRRWMVDRSLMSGNPCPTSLFELVVELLAMNGHRLSMRAAPLMPAASGCHPRASSVK
jgi:hypothetical protein